VDGTAEEVRSRFLARPLIWVSLSSFQRTVINESKVTTDLETARDDNVFAIAIPIRPVPHRRLERSLRNWSISPVKPADKKGSRVTN